MLHHPFQPANILNFYKLPNISQKNYKKWQKNNKRPGEESFFSEAFAFLGVNGYAPFLSKWKTEMNYWYRFERYDGTVSPILSPERLVVTVQQFLC